ncbi:hypothetical protein T10_7570 [Trichinella papuae]|uniref:Uncharacterized protein n=1 Tax=Trichinella papuae TaxID=268474 RepID=A0A0V1MU21_9BILA|nr:hypothetical protein T10_7570 [Trichinella papuae]
MKGKQLLVPGWDNLKSPSPAPAVALSQQPHTSLAPAELPVGVGKSEPGCYTLCAASGPTLESKRRYLSWWRHCLPAHRKFLLLASDPLQPAVSILEAAADDRMLGRLLDNSLHAHLCG